MSTRTPQESAELLILLEDRYAARAKNSLDAYCRYIEIPGAPINDDADCEKFYPDNVTPAEHHILVNNALQRVDAGEIKRLMIFMPPGSAKSTYASVVFPTWYMGRHPGASIISTSYASELALKFARKCRQITRSDHYHRVFKTSITQDNQAVHAWSLDNGAEYMCGGILGAIVGNRASGLVIDDPLKGHQAAESETIRETVWNAYLTDLRSRLKPAAWIIIIETRWHEDDPAGRILPKTYNGESGDIIAKDGEQWHVICLSAKCERHDDPLGRAIGGYLWTDWTPIKEWRQIERTVGSRNWASLYQQTPSPATGGMFKRDWIKRYNVPPANFIRIFQSWDTAQKDGQLNDPSVCTTWGETRVAYYLLHVYRAKLQYPALRPMIRSLYELACARWGVVCAVLVEDKSTGSSLIQDYRVDSGGPLPIIAIEPVGEKETRASAVSPMWESGRIAHPEYAEWLPDYESELFSFPLGTHDDQVDSSCQAIQWASTGYVRPEYEKLKIESQGRFSGRRR